MNEESDGISENENNNSEVVILPDRSQVDELLIAEPPPVARDLKAYEQKLDEKLKELGLFEDGMTLNQKEELLAVVVISCETAEQEENKRQLIKEYLDGAASLQEEIEFSLQESAWLAEEANLLCSTAESRDEDGTKIPTYIDCGPSTSLVDFDDFESLAQAEGASYRSSPEIFEDATAYSELFLDSRSSTSDTDSRKLASEADQAKQSNAFNFSVSEGDVKVAVTYPILNETDAEKTEDGEDSDGQIEMSSQTETLFLERSMACWRPCLSPVDKPLSNSRYSAEQNAKTSESENATSSLSSQAKINKYLSTFSKIATFLKKKAKRRSPSRLTSLSKPYILLHHGSCARKSCKLDNYDFMMGVTEKVENTEPEDFIPSATTLTRAKSAFHRVKPSSQGRFVSFSDQETLSKITRSGATYGSSQKFDFEQELDDSSPEVVMDGAFDKSDDEYYMGGCSTSTATLSEQLKAIPNNVVINNRSKIPGFCNLRPEVHSNSNVIAPSPIFKHTNPPSETVIKPNCIVQNNSNEDSLLEEKIVNSTEKGYSSDSSSSLIDVETIVDDEIEEFVLKRKLLPSTNKTNYSKKLSQSKKLKKNSS